MTSKKHLAHIWLLPLRLDMLRTMLQEQEDVILCCHACPHSHNGVRTGLAEKMQSMPGIETGIGTGNDTPEGEVIGRVAVSAARSPGGAATGKTAGSAAQTLEDALTGKTAGIVAQMLGYAPTGMTVASAASTVVSMAAARLLHGTPCRSRRSRAGMRWRCLPLPSPLTAAR